MKSLKENYVQACSEDSTRIIVTQSPFAKTNLLYVQEIGDFRTKPAYFTERENLDSFLLVYTIAGTGKLTYKGTTYTLRKNQIFFIDCMEYHRYWTHPKEPWELLWVHFNGYAVRGYYDLFTEEVEPILTLPSDTEIPYLLRRLIHLQFQKSVGAELLSSKLLVDLLTVCLLNKQHTKLSIKEAPDYIQGLIQEITLNYRQKLTLNQLAQRFAVSKYHMAKEFKRYTGFTPNNYIINVRITKAKELLKYSDLPVATIAAEVGIDNVSHFINLFKEREGLTPLVYRRKWQ